MIIAIFLFALLALFPFFFPGYYLSELILSFLPYITGIACIFTIISLVNFRKRMKPGYHPTRRYFWGISFLVLCIIFFIYSKQFNSFYVMEPFSQEIALGDLKTLFVNIHKENSEYEKIEQLITDTDPDMLMFLEFTDQHYNNLKSFLQSKYPYTNTTTRSKTFVGSMVFSKYPITNISDDFPQGARRYGYFSIAYQGYDIYFYLVHTSSPSSHDHFIMRNKQLKTFVQDFQKHESDKKHDAIIVVGDFNVTPRSPYYSILSDAFSGKLINMTSRLPFLFTRKMKQFPLLQAHIDHLWATPSLVIDHLEAIPFPGSDHKAFLFTVKLR